MKRILLLSIPLALFAACPAPKKGCKDTGCSAGSVCNTNTNTCELIGGGGGGGGGSTGGGGGGGSVTGGGGGSGGDAGTDAGVDAGPPIDPFDDGGTFVAGDICTYAIPVTFDGGVSADGGPLTAVTLTVDLAAETNQYKAICNGSSGASNDVIFELTLTEPKGLIITATDTSGKNQDGVLSVISSPCTRFTEISCADSQGSTIPEELIFERLPAGTWYVLLENYAADNLDDGTYDVQFELTDPLPAPPNDTCAQAQELTFTNGMATVMGTTTGAFNDTGGSPLTCSPISALKPDVFYSFTLTQPQDVTVLMDVPSASNLNPVIAITDNCGVGGAGNQRGCATGPVGSFLAHSVPAGTYFIVVDGNSNARGDFSLTVTLAPPTPSLTNDTCAMPTTLVPMVSQMVDANAAAGDYTFTCAGARGGDVVYQFTTTQPQKVTLTATGTGNADAVLSLRGAPCDDSSNEIDCVDNTVSAPEILSVLNLPAGTYYVLLAAYSASAGQFGLSLTLEAPPVPPANDTCAAAATLVPNVSQMVDLAAAVSDYTLACATPAGGEAVYTFTTTQAQRVVVTATGVGSGADAVLSLRGPPCDTATDLKCANNTFAGAPEVLTANNLPAGTYFVMLASDGSDTQFGVELALEPPRPPPANESCTTPELVTLTLGTASRTVDLTDAVADLASDLCATSSDGGDVVYQVDIPAAQTLTVTGTPVGTTLDPVLFARSPTCAMATSEVCVDAGGAGGAESLVVPNTTGAVKTVFIVVKAYRLSAPGAIDLVFTAM